MRLDFDPDRFPRAVLDFWAARFACDPAELARPAISPIPDPDQAGTGRIHESRIGARRLLRHDPSLAAALAPLADADAEGFSALGAVALVAGAAPGLELESLGEGRNYHLRPDAFRPTAPPAGYELSELDWDRDGERILAFCAQCPDDDVDEAEIEAERPDDVAVAALAEGRIVAYAGHRLWLDAWGDVGILTHPGHRGKGVGRAAVAAVVARCLADGPPPIYRAGEENPNSWRIAEALGFDWFMKITVLRAVAPGG